MDDRELPFTEHLEELRQRLKRSIIAVLVAFAFTYCLREEIFELLQMPMHGALAYYKQYNPGSSFDTVMHFKNPIEPFFTYLKLAIYAAVFLSIPYIFYQIWKFIAPGLYRHEKKATAPFIVSSTIMFVLGALFCHQIALPFGYYALLSYAGQNVVPMLMMQEYVSVTLMLLLGFGIVFEMPVLLIFLCRIGLLTPQQLARFRKYALILLFIVAAILTPPDVFSQVLLAIPMYVLYELSILGARILGKPIPREQPQAGEPKGEPSPAG
ncbi:MAG: twin-arginine translocase subunit TatC [Deltaproteobacteria bacterium]|nr:twin-arginine translocase subunit TatC [Deltaproteobacteria bacterium]